MLKSKVEVGSKVKKLTRIATIFILLGGEEVSRGGGIYEECEPSWRKGINCYG